MTAAIVDHLQASLVEYRATMASIQERPTLKGWIAVETALLPRSAKREIAAACRVLWRQKRKPETP